MKNLPAGVFAHRLVVHPGALDANGHVNNVQYVQWMQDAAIRHADGVGCTRLTTAHAATWVARSHRVEYLRPAFAEERIAVLTWVSGFRRVRSLRKYVFVREDDGVRVAQGETDWVFVDAASGKPVAIPEDVVAAFVLVPPDREP